MSASCAERSCSVSRCCTSLTHVLSCLAPRPFHAGPSQLPHSATITSTNCTADRQLAERAPRVDDVNSFEATMQQPSSEWDQHCQRVINGPPEPDVAALSQFASYPQWLRWLHQRYHYSVKQPVVADTQPDPTLLLLLCHPMSGQHVYEMLHSQPMVVDLLLTLFVNAATCTAFEDEYDESGYPAVGDEICTSDVRALIDKLPPLADLSRIRNFTSLAQRLDGIDRRLFPLLRWLLVYQPIPLRSVDKADHIPLAGCTHQFAVGQPIAALPGLRAGISLPLGCHGSPLYNWHSILHHGLRSGRLPGTGRSGSALWVAADIAVSSACAMVCQPAKHWKNSALTGDWLCVAVVEVASWEAQQAMCDVDVLVEIEYEYEEPDESAVNIRALVLLDTAVWGGEQPPSSSVANMADRLAAW